MQTTDSKYPLIIKAFKGEHTDRIPIWFMRQAGRYLPEYNEIRSELSFLDLTMNVDLACEVSIQPYLRFGLDAIIMFSDILTPLSGAGVPLHFEEKRGPILSRTIEKEADLKMLENFDANRDTSFVKEILQTILGKLTANNPPVPENYFTASGNTSDFTRPGLLGFAGAPFTLASYLIEGGTSRKFEKTKKFMYSQSELFHKLSDRLADITIDYLTMQLMSGADAVQIFDSWGGILSPSDYSEFSAPYTKKILNGLKNNSSISNKPVILFVGNGSHLLEEMSSQNPDVISLDWRVSFKEAKRLIPENIALQGNMDPLVLYGSTNRVEKEARRILDEFSNRKGYVFNLGHGIHPEAPIECVESMIRTVRNYKKQS